MWVRAVTYVLLIAATSPIWILIGALRPTRAAASPGCCSDVTAAYGLVFTDRCDGTVTITIANPSTVAGRVTINDDPTFTVAPDTAVTRHVTPIGGMLTLSLAFSGRPDTVLHEWSKPADNCPHTPQPPAAKDPAHARAPDAHPSTRPATPVHIPLSDSAPPAPAPAPVLALAPDDTVNTPSKGHVVIWQTRDKNSTGFPTAAIALLVAVLTMIFPYRRTNPRPKA